jgi:hypothetical protein
VKNLPRILWLLLETCATSAGPDRVRLAEAPLLAGPHDTSPPIGDAEVLAAELRQRITEEQWRLGIDLDLDKPIRLPSDVEEVLVGPLPTPRAVAATQRFLRGLGQTAGTGPVVTRSAAALRPARAALQAVPQPPRVVWSSEIPPGIHLPD